MYLTVSRVQRLSQAINEYNTGQGIPCEIWSSQDTIKIDVFGDVTRSYILEYHN